MTHAELAAKDILDSLPPDKREKLHTLATRQAIPINRLIRDGLLLVADQINDATADDSSSGALNMTPVGASV